MLFAVVMIVSMWYSSTNSGSNWTIKIEGQEYRISTWTAALTIVGLYLLILCFFLWQFTVLRDTAVRSVFADDFRANPGSQMSLVRFLLLVMLLTAAFLSFGRVIQLVFENVPTK
jgi:hypothetical protein